ncbi:MAG: translation elongation factor Ts [Chloroflexi bacterium]|nr:translation elongation factor Ts [Chloroflexota bacterium]
MDVSISAAQVKELRERTGAGVMECKRALVEAGGNMEKAIEILHRQGLARAEKKAGRVATQGLIDAYIHAGGRIGAMVEVNCETDFVARTDDFRQLAHDIAMQVAATAPRYIAPSDVPPDEADRANELALLAQPFIKDPSLTVEELIKRHVAKLGEAIRVRRFVRYELGEAETEA